MIKKIQGLMLASLILITAANKAEKPNLCIQLVLGAGAGCVIGTMPPLIHNMGADKAIKELSADSDYGIFNAGLSAGVGLGLYNWSKVGHFYSRKYFNSSKGRYIAAIPALWLLSMNWKSEWLKDR